MYRAIYVFVITKVAKAECSAWRVSRYFPKNVHFTLTRSCSLPRKATIFVKYNLFSWLNRKNNLQSVKMSVRAVSDPFIAYLLFNSHESTFRHKIVSWMATDLLWEIRSFVTYKSINFRFPVFRIKDWNLRKLRKLFRSGKPVDKVALHNRRIFCLAVLYRTLPRSLKISDLWAGWADLVHSGYFDPLHVKFE